MATPPPSGPGRGQPPTGEPGRGGGPAPRGRAALLNLARRAAANTSATRAAGDASAAASGPVATAAAPSAVTAAAPVSQGVAMGGAAAPAPTVGRGRAMLLAKLAASKSKASAAAAPGGGGGGAAATDETMSFKSENFDSSTLKAAPPTRPPPPPPTGAATSALASRLQGLRMGRPASPAAADASFVTAKSEALTSKSPSPPAVASPPKEEPKAKPPPPPQLSRSITPIPKAVSPLTASPTDRPGTPSAAAAAVGSGSRPATPAAAPPPPRPPMTSSPPPMSQPQLYKGSGGKPLRVTANYIRLEVEKGCGVFEHEVLFEPRVDSREERFRLINQQRELTGYVRVFDGTKLYLPHIVPPEKGQNNVHSIDSQTGEKVRLNIVYKRQRDQGDRDLIYLYNNLFNKIMKTLKLVQHNRNFFDPTQAHKIPAYNLDIWPGYATAVDRFEGGLLLQLDAANRVLRTETVRDLLLSISKKIGGGGGTASLKQEAEKQLLGTSVLTRYNNKSYIVDDIDFQCSPKATFTNEKGQTMSFIDYYKNNYGIQIKDVNQPMLIHRPKKKAHNEQDVDKIICLVPELCLLTGLTETMRADFKIMKEVGNFTRLTPARRQEVLRKFVHTIMTTPEAKAHLTDWGLKLSSDTLPLEARVLQPEVLHFGRGFKETVTPKADWGRTATTKQVLTAVSLQKWIVVFLAKNQPIVKTFCQTFQQQGPKMGINIAMPKVIGLANDRTETYLKAVRENVDSSTQAVMCVFPQMRSDRYGALKKLCLLEKPVASQVINLKTISNDKRLTSVAQKVILQVNCKLGGELWGCATPFKDLMVVGIDVYHDKSRKSGSVAGVVATVNDSLSRYYSKSMMQQEGQEILDSLKIAFVECLIKYWEVNRKFPNHIVVFRDGVGDGQLEVAEKHEAEQFIRAFRHVKDGGGSAASAAASAKLANVIPKDYNPGFTFVVVQKRINTRIYACLPRGPKMDFENPPPGTVLDHTVTRYKYRDFFLVPQSVNQGTVSPTHFIVVRELGAEPNGGNGGAGGPPTPKMEASDVQKLAYKLTHMYFNWPGTVRVPSPVQYAHKMVDLVGQYVHKVPSPQLDDKLYYL